MVECMFGKLKCYRRITTRFEKKAKHFKENLAFSEVLFWQSWQLDKAQI